MECLLTVNDINFKYGIEPILESLSLSINRGDRVAIVGANGAGKSTLLHILSGKIQDFEGKRSFKNSLKYEIVEQFLNKDLLEYSLLEALLLKFPAEERVYKQYLAEKMLLDLFFNENEFETKVKHLSGGGQNRLMFARSIITEPDLIFMDEPTNHMDLKNLLYLEEYLKTSSDFSFVIISHDKSFLDQVTNRTLIVRDCTAYSFNLNYTNSLESLAKADQDAENKRKLEEKEINRIRKSAHRLAIWGKTYDNEDLSKKAKSMEKRADRLEETKTFVSNGNPYSLSLRFDQLNSKIAMQFHNFPVYYGDLSTSENHLFKIEKLYINRGEKIALLGNNGVGKSTLIKMILNNLKKGATTDNFSSAPNLNLGYYDQEQENLNPTESIWNALYRLTKADNNKIKNVLIKAGFSYDRKDNKIKDLSGGEKSRVIFCALDMIDANFLILDEPTNHIDLEGKKELVHSIKNSPITVLLTGHDRSFIEEVCDRFLWIKDGEILEITDPSLYYKSLLYQSDSPITKSTAKAQNEVLSLTDDLEMDELILEKILICESKLDQEKNRKLKHRNDNLIIKLEEEIKTLYQKMDD